jgi:YfiH family protein
VKILNLTQLTIICKSIHHVEWPVQNVLAFTTTRHNPTNNNQTEASASNASFNRFNLGLHVGDYPEKVLANRQNLLSLLPKNTQIQWLEQVHGSEVLLIESHNKQALIADAAITRQKNIALAIMTADCLPILLTAKDGSEIAAIHGGWKPLAKNIIANTLNKMSTRNEDIIVWLGPCISKQAFEVGEDVRSAFVNQSKSFIAAFSRPTSTSDSKQNNSQLKYFADLALIAKIQLTALGVKNLQHLEHCTYNDKAAYFSYRREKLTGRMASIISFT